jgi:hypothetical protein
MNYSPRPRALSALLLAVGPILAIGCAGTDVDPPDPPDPTCPAQLPEVAVRCDLPSCSSSTGTKTSALSDLSRDEAPRFIAISSLASELFVNETVNLTYAKQVPGALLAQRVQARRRARLAPEHYRTVFGERRAARLDAEHLIRERAVRDLPTGPLLGTGVRGVTPDPEEEVLEQDTSCSADAPSCGESALCVIPSGETMGTCSSALTLKWRDQSSPGQFEDVAATVRKVGQFAAIVTDDADTVGDADVDELLRRFDARIAPVDHALFGEPTDEMGRDRDQNGVVIMFLTSRVGTISSDLAGFFQSTDIQDPATTPSSNGADLLYLQPPGGAITLDNLSGTMAHEYQHLINYYAKVVTRASSAEERWLDEGLSTFAEDFTGYGADAFKNIAAYLVGVGETSLTGFGLVYTNESDADSFERRGMAHLLVRYLFEQAGGAALTGEADLADGGGLAAVKALVQSPDTGVDLLSQARTGRSLASWLQDLLTVVAIDGAGYPQVSCNPDYTLGAPESDSFTGYTRGIDLRTSMVDFSGGTIPLNGPSTPSFESEDVPVPANGGEIRAVDVADTLQISLGGDAETLVDYAVGLRVLPVRAN